MSVVLWECSWLSKIYSDSKSRVSEVKNSRNIFTLFLPQSKGPFSKTVRESCPQIRVRLQNYQYQTPRSIGFDGEVFYNVWQEMEPPQLVVVDRRPQFQKRWNWHVHRLFFIDFSLNLPLFIIEVRTMLGMAMEVLLFTHEKRSFPNHWFRGWESLRKRLDTISTRILLPPITHARSSVRTIMFYYERNLLEKFCCNRRKLYRQKLPNSEETRSTASRRKRFSSPKMALPHKRPSRNSLTMWRSLNEKRLRHLNNRLNIPTAKIVVVVVVQDDTRDH